MLTQGSKTRHLSIAEVADHFAVSEYTIRREIARNKIRAIRIGRQIRIPASEIERLEGGDSV